MLPLESVPNFSEGRDRATIAAIGSALAQHARLLDVHSDADHNRSVFTLVGSEQELADALLAGIAVAIERIDLRAARRCPPADRCRRRGADRPARAGRLRAGARARPWPSASASARSWGCRSSSTRRPSAARRSTAAAGRPGSRRASTRASWLADFGPARLHESAGGVILGARAAADRVQREPARARSRLRARSPRSSASGAAVSRRAGARPRPADGRVSSRSR